MATAIITGASRGLGLALAESLVADGWKVVIDGRNRQALDKAVAALGPLATAIAGDVSDPAHRTELVAAARASGGLDLLVNNASILGPSPLPRLRDFPLDALEDLYGVNVVAPLALVQAALPMLEAAGGSILNITSDAAVEGYEGWGMRGES